MTVSFICCDIILIYYLFAHIHTLYLSICIYICIYLFICFQLEIKVCDQPVTKPHVIPPRHFADDNIGMEYHNCVVTQVDKESPADICGIKKGESIYEVCVLTPLHYVQKTK